MCRVEDVYHSVCRHWGDRRCYAPCPAFPEYKGRRHGCGNTEIIGSAMSATNCQACSREERLSASLLITSDHGFSKFSESARMNIAKCHQQRNADSPEIDALSQRQQRGRQSFLREISGRQRSPWKTRTRSNSQHLGATPLN